jgi:FkbM family methyltransferase
MNAADAGLEVLATNAEYWTAIDGDRSLRLNYDLNKNSVVFDLGGYQGDWSEQIYRRYGCRVFVFEPVPGFAHKIAERFRGNSNVSVFEFGLGSKNDKIRLTLSDNATSSFTSGQGRVIDGEIKDFAEFVRESGIQDIDLLKINIEGGEFELLDHLISTKYIDRVRHIQVQFHQFVPGAEELVRDLRKRLWTTHILSYSLDWIWDGWVLNSSSQTQESNLEAGLRWHQEALREMSLRASAYRFSNQKLEASNRILAEDSRILNRWRDRLGPILRTRRFFHRVLAGLGR